MKVSISNARGQLAQLVRQAQAGHEIVLTLNWKAVARLVPIGLAGEASQASADGVAPGENGPAK